MLGHVLHVPSDTPDQLAKQFTLKGDTEYKQRCSRHQTNLLETTAKVVVRSRHSQLERAEDKWQALGKE